MPTGGTVVGWIATRRARIALAVALLCMSVATALPGLPSPAPGELAPNILIVLTDDQSADTMPAGSGPHGMPWLQAQIEDPTQPWVRFSNAFLDTPLCCPSRASILTGLTSPHTGVRSNTDGDELDEEATLATWLHDAGYTTGLVGKYLNGYPWDRGPYVPVGWDRFVAKRNATLETTYYDFDLIDQGVPRHVAVSPQGYATTWLADQALSFLRAAPADRPWFLVFSPPAPHSPWLPAPSDLGAFASHHVPGPSLSELNDVRGKPAWVRNLPPLSPSHRALLLTQRRQARETLLAVDRSMQELTSLVSARGELDRTIIVFLTDNGFAFGEHRWTGKRCPYDPCVRTPMVIRSPWASHATVEDPVLNVDLAPTFLDLAGSFGLVADPATDGVSLRPYLDRSTTDPPPARAGVLMQYAGDSAVPPWRAIRTKEFAYIENDDGWLELYDLAGTLGRADPGELHNRAGDPRYDDVVSQMAVMLDAFVRAESPG